MAELQIEDTEIGKGKACKAGGEIVIHGFLASFFI
jgi:hypothetical protein